MHYCREREIGVIMRVKRGIECEVRGCSRCYSKLHPRGVFIDDDDRRRSNDIEGTAIVHPTSESIYRTTTTLSIDSFTSILSTERETPLSTDTILRARVE